MKRLADKTAVVTGAGAGIGREIALLFAAEGARVACIDIDADAAAETAALVASEGQEACAVCADIAAPAAVRAARDAVSARLGPAHILINNAGCGSAGTVQSLTFEQWQRALDVNLSGAFSASKAFWPDLERAGRGAIVNNSSIMGLAGDANSAAYVSAKAALVGLTKALAADGAALGIRVNCVCPGFVDTPAMRVLFDPSPGATLTREGIEGKIPLRRMASTREVAHAFLFLASDDASYVTGSTLVIDGGATLGYKGSDI